MQTHRCSPRGPWAALARPRAPLERAQDMWTLVGRARSGHHQLQITVGADAGPGPRCQKSDTSGEELPDGAGGHGAGPPATAAPRCRSPGPGRLRMPGARGGSGGRGSGSAVGRRWGLVAEPPRRACLCDRRDLLRLPLRLPVPFAKGALYGIKNRICCFKLLQF